MCPATIALACSLGPVAYVLMAFVTGVLLAKYDDYFAHSHETAFLAICALGWPLAAIGYALAGAGKLMAKIGNG